MLMTNLLPIMGYHHKIRFVGFLYLIIMNTLLRHDILAVYVVGLIMGSFIISMVTKSLLLSMYQIFPLQWVARQNLIFKMRWVHFVLLKRWTYQTKPFYK